MLGEGNFSTKMALKLDSFGFVIYVINSTTLIGSLIYFKVLERQYRMKIKTLQLCMAILLCNCMILYGICYLIMSIVVIEWIHEAQNNPLPEYPASGIVLTDFLQAMAAIFALSTCFIVAYLMLNIGRTPGNGIRRHQEEKSQTGYKLKAEDDDYVERRLRAIIANEHLYRSNGDTLQDSASIGDELLYTYDPNQADLAQDEDFISRKSSCEDNLYADPRFFKLLHSQLRVYEQMSENLSNIKLEGMQQGLFDTLFDSQLGDTR